MQNFEASDIIYLFLDGEADDTQKSMLFAAMANDVSLQAEFGEALKFHTSYPRPAVSEGAPPAALSQSLFSKAGFNPELIAPLTLATAGVAQSSFFKTLVAKMFAAKSVLVPLSSALVGSVMTAVTLLTFAPDVFKTPAAEAHNVAEQNEVLKEKSLPDAIADNSFKNSENIAQEISRNSFKSTNNSGQNISKGNGNYQKDINEDPFKNNTPNKPSPNLTTPDEPEKIEAPKPEIIVNTISVHDTVIKTVEIEKQQAETTYGVYNRKLGTIALYPARSIAGGGYSLLNNTAVGGFLKLNEHHSIIAEFGEEDFPVYVMNSAREFEFRTTLQWAAGGYRYTLSGISFLGEIKPYGQAQLGYTFSGSGALLKTLAGVQWQPLRNVSFDGGVEATALLYRLNGSGELTGKTGYFYGVTIHF